jgi:hypothetical protein
MARSFEVRNSRSATDLGGDLQTKTNPCSKYTKRKGN